MEKLQLLLASLLALLLYSCEGKSGEGGVPAYLVGEDAVVQVDADSCELEVTSFEAGAAWFAYVRYPGQGQRSWLDVYPARGNAGRHTLKAVVHKNGTKEKRMAEVSVQCHDEKLVYVIEQAGGSPASGDSGGEEGDPEKPGVGKKPLVRSISVKCYKEFNELQDVVQVVFEYDAENRLRSSRCNRLLEGQKPLLETIFAERSDGTVRYLVDNSGKREEWVATVSGSRFSRIGDCRISYSEEGYPMSVEHVRGQWSMDWAGGNLQSVSCRNKMAAFHYGKFVPTGNIDMNALLLNGFHSPFHLGKILLFEQGNWGVSSESLPDKIETEIGIYLYVYVLDASGERIMQIQEFDSSSSEPFLFKTFDFEYL